MPKWSVGWRALALTPLVTFYEPILDRWDTFQCKQSSCIGLASSVPQAWLWPAQRCAGPRMPCSLESGSARRGAAQEAMLRPWAECDK